MKKEYVKASSEDIPQFIRFLYPKMSIEMYREMSKHQHFLSK